MCTRIAIIGAGQVGSTVAYALLRSGLYSEILLIEPRLDVRDGHARDLSDAAFCENIPTRVRAGTYKEAGQCDLVVLTAGSRRNLGETNAQMLDRSTAIVHSIIERMQPLNSDLIMLVVSNPVDVFTTLVQQVSGLPASKVIGSGTFLDTVRLTRILSERYQLSALPVDLYVLGEHDGAQFPTWSCATIAGFPVSEELQLSSEDQIEISKTCRHESQYIIHKKGAITFGIASVAAAICSSIVLDQRDVLVVSHFQDMFGCCLSLPAELGRQGIIRTIELALSEEEDLKLEASGAAIRERFHNLVKEDEA